MFRGVDQWEVLTWVGVCMFVDCRCLASWFGGVWLPLVVLKKWGAEVGWGVMCARCQRL